MTDPDELTASQAEDLAAFRAAVADAQPLPAVNRVELAKPPSRRIQPPRPIAEKPTKRRKTADALPARWQQQEAATPRLPADPEQAFFLRAMAGVAPLQNVNRVVLGQPAPPPQPQQSIADRQAVLHESLHAPIGLEDRLEGGDEPFHLRQGLAITVLRDLRRGRWVIQDEIDLHGLNREQARHLVASFLQTCLHQGKRCVRIVHGKGLGSPQKQSILRQLVRGWLAQRQEVLAYCQAKPQDGGEGALLVLLRSPKQNGAA
ncbi:Smr/MutS family protein [Azonexus sp.]|uniref:Smr/MutS family protein n=1 Tax=Azonexus sp. TaxID=1872668 RepID=UPI0027B8DF16|nr:Smr/MutS family protein [Azonexus sp.]